MAADQSAGMHSEMLPFASLPACVHVCMLSTLSSPMPTFESHAKESRRLQQTRLVAGSVLSSARERVRVAGGLRSDHPT
eukprot:328746-Chlamydomonas_euryale.AAC.4